MDQEQRQDQQEYDAYDLRRIFDQMEMDLITSMRKTLAHHKREEEKEGFSWEQWQKAKLRDLKQFRQNCKEIVGSRSKEIEKTIDSALQGSYKKGVSMFSRALQKAKGFFSRGKLSLPESLTGISQEAEPPAETNFFVSNDQKLQTLAEIVKSDMQTAQNAAMRRVNDIYRQTIFKAEIHMSAGAKTLQQAVDMAVKEFLQNGIDCIEYKDGKRVNIGSYAEMALRTASHRAYLMGEGKKRQEWGIHTVFVSAHANTCEKCAPWQGKVLVDDVFSGGTKEEADRLGVPLLSEAISTGLLHPNCRHTLATYFPGVTVLPTIPDEKAAVELYKQERIQRDLERRIRKAKRIIASTTDPEELQKANDALKDLQWKLQQHLKENPQLRRDPRREQDYTGSGYSRIEEIGARSPLIYSNTPVHYDSTKDYSLHLEGRSEAVNQGLSSAIEDVARKGNADRCEHMYLVDLKTGKLVHYETNGEPDSVGFDFWGVAEKNPGKEFAFVHNHNIVSSLSLTDLETVITTPNITMQIAVQNNGVIYLAERTEDALRGGYDPDLLFEKELKALNEQLKNGIITPAERTIQREEILVDSMLRKFFKKGVQVFDRTK